MIVVSNIITILTPFIDQERGIYTGYGLQDDKHVWVRAGIQDAPTERGDWGERVSIDRVLLAEQGRMMWAMKVQVVAKEEGMRRRAMNFEIK